MVAPHPSKTAGTVVASPRRASAQDASCNNGNALEADLSAKMRPEPDPGPGD